MIVNFFMYNSNDTSVKMFISLCVSIQDIRKILFLGVIHHHYVWYHPEHSLKHNIESVSTKTKYIHP